MALIIVVDDDHDILRLARELLATAGHEVLTAENAVEAIELLNQHGCEAMITDANMPQHSGYDLLRTIRNNSKWSDLPIAMLTGRREKKDIERAVELGVDDYIVKPIDPLLFLQKIELLLKKKVQQKTETQTNFTAADITSPGKMNVDIELRSISELGVVIHTPIELKNGVTIRPEIALFEEIGCKVPLMKVISSTKTQDRTFETRLLFIGAEEATLAKVRSWIYSHATKIRRAS